MEKELTNKNTNAQNSVSGIFVKGRAISSTATSFDRKDGSGKGVIVKNEIALMPGLAVMESFFDPSEDTEVELRGKEVVKFPRFEEFQEVHLRVLKFDVQNEVLRIKKAELVV